MTDIRRADPGARRQALLFLVFAAIVGSLLIFGFNRYRTPLHEWLLSQPEELGRRVKLLLFVAAAVLSVPLIAFAAHFWLIGNKVVTTQTFPPPEYWVVRDTRVIVGASAVLRGRTVRVLAVLLATSCAAMWLALWWLAKFVSE